MKRSEKVLRVSCVLMLVSLGLMTWGIFVPTHIPILVSMSVGLGFLFGSLMLYLGVVIAELRRSVLARHKPTEEKTVASAAQAAGAVATATADAAASAADKADGKAAAENPAVEEQPKELG